MNSHGRGLILVMLFLAGVINYLDRSALSVAAPLIQAEFSLSAGQMGLLFSAFFVGWLFSISWAAGLPIALARRPPCCSPCCCGQRSVV